MTMFSLGFLYREYMWVSQQYIYNLWVAISLVSLEGHLLQQFSLRAAKAGFQAWVAQPLQGYH
jgi:hypothetical protein